MPATDRATGNMAHPTLEDVRRLGSWRPARGVVSVYLRFDPADRGGGWRTELRNGLAVVLDEADRLDHEMRSAVQATGERLLERFDDRDHRGLPRGEIGFVEVAQTPAEEHWWPTRFPLHTSGTALRDTPAIAPLFSLIEMGRPRGVALVSAERVRLLEWAPGSLEELESWELAVFSRDWRERKARGVSDPARSRGVSASGHDQFGERLNENRHRFLGECRVLAAQAAAGREWPEILAFGPSPHLTSFSEGGAPAGPAVEPAGDGDLVPIPLGQLEAPIAKAAYRIIDERDHRLVERIVEEARGHTHGALGLQETLSALGEGRVDHLVLAARHLVLEPDQARARTRVADGDPRSQTAPSVDCELLVRRALDSGASISAVSDAAAELIDAAEGVAALLRY